MGKQIIENIGKKLAVLIILFSVITTAAVALAAGDDNSSSGGGDSGGTGSGGTGSGGSDPGGSSSSGITYSATAIMKDAKGNNVGLATFTEDTSGMVHINVNVKGLKPGMHGIHIHNKGSCIEPSFTSAGEHYNPLGKEHGLNNPKGSHAGDLPNLKVGEDGRGCMNVTTDLVTLSPGPTTLFTGNGTSLVIHADSDNQMTNPAGNSGAKIACGVIEKK